MMGKIKKLAKKLAKWFIAFLYFELRNAISI